jgi:hypothetical protein
VKLEHVEQLDGLSEYENLIRAVLTPLLKQCLEHLSNYVSWRPATTTCTHEPFPAEVGLQHGSTISGGGVLVGEGNARPLAVALILMDIISPRTARRAISGADLLVVVLVI